MLPHQSMRRHALQHRLIRANRGVEVLAATRVSTRDRAIEPLFVGLFPSLTKAFSGKAASNEDM